MLLEKSVVVVVLAYNHQDYIEECLASILQQNFAGVSKILVLDDASSDNTKNIVDGIKINNDDAIIYIRNEENLGVGANYKKALDVALSLGVEYIAFLEGDDYWVDDQHLKNAVQYLSLNSNVLGYGSNCLMDDPSYSVKKKFGDEQDGIISSTYFFNEWCVHLLTFVVRSSFFSKLPYSDAPIKTSFDMFLRRALALSGEFYYAGSKIAGCYRRNASGVSYQIILDEKKIKAYSMFKEEIEILEYFLRLHHKPVLPKTRWPLAIKNLIYLSSNIKTISFDYFLIVRSFKFLSQTYRTPYGIRLFVYIYIARFVKLFLFQFAKKNY